MDVWWIWLQMYSTCTVHMCGINFEAFVTSWAVNIYHNVPDKHTHNFQRAKGNRGSKTSDNVKRNYGLRKRENIAEHMKESKDMRLSVACAC